MSITVLVVTPDVQKWRSLSDVPPHCDYQIKAAKGSGVLFYSPLPACHSESRVSPSVVLVACCLQGCLCRRRL